MSRSKALAWLLACSFGPWAAAGSLEVVTARRMRGAPMPSSLYFVGLDDLARRFEARLGWDAKTGARSLEKGARRAVVLPGVAFALVGSEGVPLREPVVWRYGRVYVPRSLVPRLEELFHTRPARPSPPRPSRRRSSLRSTKKSTGRKARDRCCGWETSRFVWSAFRNTFFCCAPRPTSRPCRRIFTLAVAPFPRTTA